MTFLVLPYMPLGAELYRTEGWFVRDGEQFASGFPSFFVGARTPTSSKSEKQALSTL
jgi:hypothetical protein